MLKLFTFLTTIENYFQVKQLLFAHFLSFAVHTRLKQRAKSLVVLVNKRRRAVPNQHAQHYGSPVKLNLRRRRGFFDRIASVAGAIDKK